MRRLEWNLQEGAITARPAQRLAGSRSRTHRGLFRAALSIQRTVHARERTCTSRPTPRDEVTMHLEHLFEPPRAIDRPVVSWTSSLEHPGMVCLERRPGPSRLPRPVRLTSSPPCTSAEKDHPPMVRGHAVETSAQFATGAATSPWPCSDCSAGRCSTRSSPQV